MTVSRFECPRCQTMFTKNTVGEDAFVECPSCGALALPAGEATDDLSRALSGVHGAPTQLEQPQHSSSDAGPAHGGVFSGLLSPAAPEPPPLPPAPPQAPRDSIDFNFNHIELDLGDAASAAPRRSPMTAPSRNAVSTAALQALRAIDVNTDAGSTPWGGMSDDAFGDLEKAFNAMDLRPSTAPAGGALSDNDQAFLRSGRTAPPLPNIGHDGPTGQREAPPKRPPPRRTTKPKAARPNHLTLSQETKRLAFLPLAVETTPLPAARRAMTAQVPAASSSRGVDARGEPAAQQRTVDDPTDLVRDHRDILPPRQVPSAFAGLTFARVVAVVVLSSIIGAAIGALMTPKPQRPNTARARAEVYFAAGNRFYDEGRYDDALGAFKQATNVDPTFAPAHRAKGAALAKRSQYDAAADAYQKYLELEPSALDAKDAKDAIARRAAATAP